MDYTSTRQQKDTKSPSTQQFRYFALISFFLLFTTSSQGIYSVISLPFTVAVGAPAQLRFKNGTELSATKKYAGEYFQVPPTLMLYDAGGNFISTDSASAVLVSIEQNPSSGSLLPLKNLFVTAKSGEMRFHAIKIDRYGFNYTLRFDLFNYSFAYSQFSPSNVSIISEKFHILHGFPKRVVLAERASGAWAGNEPFYNQPKLFLADGGGNVLTTDFKSIGVMHLTSSLSTHKQIVVDTSDAPQTKLTRLYLNKLNNTYGAGEVFQICVESNYLLYLNSTDVDGVLSGITPSQLPFLRLNVISLTNNNVSQRAHLSTTEYPTRLLTFEYTVQEGDFFNGQKQFLDQLAFITLNHSFTDGNNRPIDLTLPVRTINASVEIHTKSPQVITVAVNASKAIYHPGDCLDFSVTFDQPVIVSGSPYLLLSVNNISNDLDRAIYDPPLTLREGNPATVHFLYVVSEESNPLAEIGPLRFQLPEIICRNSTWNMSFAAEINNHTAYHYGYRLVSKSGGWIRRQSTWPVTSVEYNISAVVLQSFYSNYTVLVSRTIPSINLTYGLQTDFTRAIAYPGDSISLFLKFSDPLVVIGRGLYLYLSVGRLSTSSPAPIGMASFMRVLEDNVTLEFQYTVEMNTAVNALTIASGRNALKIVTNDTTVKTLATFPTQDVDLKTIGLDSGVSALPAFKVIQLRSDPPVVVNVTLARTIPAASILYSDNQAFIEVSFTEPVIATCDPVLVLDFPSFYREAQYISGNGSKVLQFRYVFLIGDLANHQFKFRPSPNALCATSLCPQKTNCQIYASSDHPILPANLLLNSSLAVLGNLTILPLPLGRNTTIKLVRVRESAGEYGVGSVFHIDVEFSDIVSFRSACTNRPTLALNLPNRWAKYYQGSGSSTLTFVYITQANDTLLSVDFGVQAIAHQSSAISLSPSCPIVNQANEAVNVSMSNPTIYVASGIRIDPSPPHITSSLIDIPQDEFNYTSGNILRIALSVSKPVIVGGIAPRVTMLFEQPGPVDAIFDQPSSSPTKLIFLYKIRPTDRFRNFTIQNQRINDLHGLSQILRISSIPSTPLNLSIPQSSVQIELRPRQENLIFDEVSRVIEVRSLNKTGNYTAGDLLYFEVMFSHYVVSLGESFLQLNVGGYTDTANATFIGYRTTSNGWVDANYLSPTNQTKILIYEYMVQEDDLSLALDYVDCSSLIIGLTSTHTAGYIKTFPDNQLGVDADLDLPPPGSSGSISATSIIRIDGRRPYLRTLRFLNEDGVYSTNSTIFIAAEFNAPVVVLNGNPFLLLETGAIKQPAFYLSGSGTQTLIFSYSPEPGDFASFLDYYASRKDLLSAGGSFQYNNASILRKSQHPLAPAEIWLNPSRAFLEGTTTVIADGGILQFVNSSISGRGPDFLLYYEVHPTDEFFTLTTSQWLYSSFSAEYLLRPKSALQGELVGSAVAIEGDIAVVASDYFNKSVTTVQVVTIKVADGLPTREVQLISTSIQPQPSVQSFHTTADVGETVGGSFQIIVPGVGASRLIPASVDAGTLQNLIQFDLPTIGGVTVTAEPYLYCACLNAFTWTITFTEQTVGVFNAISLNGNSLTGGGVGISSAAIIQSPSRLAGSFTLSALGKTTPAIPYDADVTSITRAIQTLGLSVYDVSVSMTVVTTLTRTWSITFAAYHESYEIPELQADASGLSGGLNPSVFVQISRKGVHGPKGIAGSFQLTFRGNTTRQLYPNITSSEMKDALEALPSINYVNVNRTLITPDIGAYSWTIEFVSINYHTARGYYEEYHQVNAEPLVATNNLIATDPTIEVDAKWTLGDANLIDSAARQGTYGAGAGAVFLFQRQNESWKEVATLVGNDTEENNRFGSAVAIDDDVILVGAVGASMNGHPEKQAIHCLADNGTFVLAFRGWKTNPINYNVTRDELVEAIISPTTVFSNLYSITAVTIDDWGSGGLCSNNTAVITFFRPVDGAINIFDVDNGPALELLQLSDSTLSLDNDASDAKLTIFEVQQGTWRVHGAVSDPQQIGAAYIFRLHKTCDPSQQLMQCWKSTWRQEKQFFPLLSRQFSQFGQAVELDGGVAIVSAPGSALQAGYVYVYEYDATTSTWPLLQVLTDPAVSTQSRFGQAISKSGNTIIISSPGYSNSSGSAYAYTRPPTGGVFVFAQILNPPNIYSLDDYSFYGQAVGISGDLVAVGAPGYDDRSIFLGTAAASVKLTNSGGVFIFTRPNANGLFTFLQKLTPSNVREYDNFGYQLKIDAQTILASSVPLYQGENSPAKAVIDVKTSSTYGHTPLGGYFKLSWRGRNDSSSTSSLFTSRPIPFNVSATSLKRILEDDLRTEKLLVSRSDVDVYNGGYIWSVTFLRYRQDVDNFITDSSLLLGTKASVTATLRVSTAPKIRNLVHVFQFNYSTSLFTEQVYLTPYRYQGNDLCGTSLSLSQDYALVGCPNRDLDVSGYNSGAAMVYDLNLLSLQFTSKSTNITEGEATLVTLTRDPNYSNATVARDVIFYQQTVDRNANLTVQQYFSDHYALGSEASLGSRLTVLDEIGIVGKAMARSQYYGSPTERASRWVDGRYDYRAIADYVQVKEPNILLSESAVTGMTITTNNDSLVELPQEAFVVTVSLPGIWPSVLGKLYHPIHLKDFSTGLVGNKQRYGEVLLSSQDYKPGESLGSVVAFDLNYGALFLGAPLASIGSLEKVGRVLQFNRENISWDTSSSPAAIFSPTSPYTPSFGGNFGAAMAFSVVQEASRAVLAVGEPLNNRVFLYSAQQGQFSRRVFSLEQVFSVADADEQRDLFGVSLAMDNHVLVVGAPGLETVYVYFNYYSAADAMWRWKGPTVVRSSDYDVDIINGVMRPHRQGFGTSVSMAGRSIVVGAPYANYDKHGTYLTENYDTEGIDILGVGKGKVYVFLSLPKSVRVCVSAEQILSRGSFRLVVDNFGERTRTTPLLFNSSAAILQTALLKLSNVEQVVVTAHREYYGQNKTAYRYCWDLVFYADWMSHNSSNIFAEWNATCPNCTLFNYPAPSNQNQSEVSTVVLAQPSDFFQVAGLNAFDGRQGDRFGASVAIDGNTIVVGAPYSAAATVTTWDFEAGKLFGWSKTGDAFDYQPTYGDNSRYRASDRSSSFFSSIDDRQQYRSVSSNMKGLYYVSTLEQRPGDEDNYLLPNPDFPPGNCQGTGPTGVLSSDVFVILGNSISFYIGGGCDIFSVYVELLVDGKSVAKRTGRCSEAMELVSFDVSLVKNRAGQLRVVDNSTSLWGYISVDHFVFDWPVQGASRSVGGNLAFVNGGNIETPLSGAAYVFKRIQSNDSSSNCLKGGEADCVWEFDSKLLPSDKRATSLFGASVAVSDESGIILISSPASPLMQSYKDTPTVYPYVTVDGVGRASGLDFPLNASLMTLFQSFPSFSTESSGAFGVWQEMNSSGIFPQLLPSSAVGAVYLFTKKFPVLGYTGQWAKQPSWKNTEKAKIQPMVDGTAGDWFGQGLAFDGQMMLIGAPGHHAQSENANGAAYFFHSEFAAVRFSQGTFVVLEGEEKLVTLTLLRDLQVFAGEIVLEYATSDLTARGVDTEYFDYCLSLPVEVRGGLRCGDYEQTVGHVVIPAGVTSGGFTVRVMDDRCYSPFMKYLQVSDLRHRLFIAHLRCRRSRCQCRVAVRCKERTWRRSFASMTMISITSQVPVLSQHALALSSMRKASSTIFPSRVRHRVM